LSAFPRPGARCCSPGARMYRCWGSGNSIFSTCSVTRWHGCVRASFPCLPKRLATPAALTDLRWDAAARLAEPHTRGALATVVGAVHRPVHGSATARATGLLADEWRENESLSVIRELGGRDATCRWARSARLDHAAQAAANAHCRGRVARRPPGTSAPSRAPLGCRRRRDRRSGPSRRPRPARGDRLNPYSASCSYAVDWNDSRCSGDTPWRAIAARCSGVE